MKLLNINSVEKALIPWEHLNDLKYLREMAEGDECSEAIYAFNYGRIIGIQQERARRKGEEYEKAILADDLFFDLYKLANEGAEIIQTEDLDDFFEHMNNYVNTEMMEAVRDKVSKMLSVIKKLELQKRKEAPR